MFVCLFDVLRRAALASVYIRFFFSVQIIRLLANHPNYQITLMTADRKAGQSIGSVFPHLVKQVSLVN